MSRPKFIIPPVKTPSQMAGIDKQILTKSIDDGVYPLAMAKEIRLDRIQPDPNQPRRTWDQGKMEELAASIREQGILQPIVVEYVDDGNYFRLIHGERRWRAANMAGLQTIPAIIKKVDDNTKLAQQLIENIQREDLNDVDRARALKQLKVNLGSPSWEVIADKVGISKRRVLQLVDITKLPEPVQENIRAGKLTEKHGRAVRMLPEEQQIEFAEAVRDQQLSGDQSLEAAKTLKGEPHITIDEAVSLVKEKKTRASAPTPDVAVDAPAAVGSPDGAASPAPAEVPTAESQALRDPAPPDPLAQLAQVPNIIRGIDPQTADPSRLCNLLEEIIAEVQSLLRSLGARAL
ncbi:MAG: ParB/RepB/Spo0J family partition protein [Chloroflexi bacterium]|nr:ParB/RepB/Spo0J family partition protein [Chloroflexota bacterium]